MADWKQKNKLGQGDLEDSDFGYSYYVEVQFPGSGDSTESDPPK